MNKKVNSFSIPYEEKCRLLLLFIYSSLADEEGKIDVGK